MKKKVILSLISLLCIGSTCLTSCMKDGVDGKDGINGVDGIAGKDGVDGKDGTSIYSSEGVPNSNLGKIGDLYVDSESGDLYSKGESGWIKTGNIKGAKGDDGTDGKDGVSIVNVSKTSVDNVDTYTVTYSDGTSSTFTVTNGVDGKPGAIGQPGTDGHTPVITIGPNGNWYVDGQDTGYAAQGPKGDNGPQGEKGDKGNDGAKGDKGDAGVSVVGTHIDENGDLICEMSDGTTINAGHVKDVTKHTVNFYVDDEVVQTLSVSDGEKISAPSDELAAGYTINSWNSKDDGGYRWLFSAYTVTFDLNLYADFTYNEYTVTYVDAKYNTKIDDLKVKYENPYTLSTIENQPGWTFSGWKTDDGELFDNLGTYRFTSDLILYAYWTANQYRITLDPNQGYVSSTEITVTYDSEYELPAPTRTNYTFLGWYDKNDSKVSSKDIWKQTEDVTYTAKWTGDKHTYTFDPGEGTCVLDSMVIGWEEAYELPTPNVPTSDASEGLTYKYTFEGWYLNDTLIPQSGTSWTYSDADGTLVAKYVVADSMTYGIYPQTHVSDNTLISALDSLMTPESNGWYLYDGDYYAKASAKLYASGYKFTDGTGITHGKTYWYKCEPITWKVLSYEDGTCFLVSTKVLDVQQYDSSSNNYKNSGVRSWLNDTFYATAFSLGNSYIQNVEVDNSASTTISSNNSNACENTYDNVYLLSYRDYVNASYFADNVSRCFKITDWVIANGMCVINNNENGLYWTRSPTNLSSSNVSRVFNNGVIGNDTMNSTCNGVCPAITIKL